MLEALSTSSRTDIDNPAETKTYSNPVHAANFPDPFVIKHLGEYWAISTGIAKDGRIFGMMHSSDLVNWTELPGAMAPIESTDANISFIHYWAPEIYRFGESFYLYYSVGNETYMNLRVATASHPAGPYTDSGHVLTKEQFAIDAHVFKDEDGQHFLFYATDFLEHSHIGTGTVVDAFEDPFTLEGEPKPVIRAKHDWQVYDPARAERGGVRWHTVEGPTVLKRKGIYYEMFSGGNWQNNSYGVSYATTTDIEGDDEWEQTCDGEKTLPIIRTITDEGKRSVIGPGHNSVVLGPSNIEHICVYHQWDKDKQNRVLSIDRMDFVGEKLIVLGPTTSARSAPALSAFSKADPDDHLITLDGPTAVIRSFIDISNGRNCKILILTQSEELKLELRNAALLISQSDELVDRTDLPLSLNGFRAENVFALDVVVNCEQITVKIEGQLVWQGALPDEAKQLQIVNAGHGLSHIEMSYGWEDLFTQEEVESIGWIEMSGDADAEVNDGALHLEGDSEDHIVIKAVPSEHYELIVNARFVNGDSETTRKLAFGIYPALPEQGYSNEEYPLITVSWESEAWRLDANSSLVKKQFDLPQDFDPSEYHQFRFRKLGTRLHFMLDTTELGTLDVPELTSYVGLYASGCEAAFEMVKLIATH